MEIESKELQEYIRSSINAIKKSVENTGFKIIKLEINGVSHHSLLKYFVKEAYKKYITKNLF